MSVKALAIDLYKAQQIVIGLESELENPAAPDKEKIREELRIARAEWKVLRRMLDGRKETKEKPLPSSYGRSNW